MIRCEYQPLLEPAALARLVAELRRSPIGVGSRPLTPALIRTVSAAVIAFAELGGRSELAARRCEPAMIELGRRSARRGQSAPELLHTFDIVSTRCLRRVDDLVRPVDPAISVRALQPRLRIYLPLLRQAAAIGHRQASDLLALPPDRRRAVVFEALFRPVVVSTTMLRLAGIDTTGDHAPVAWVDRPAPSCLLDEVLALSTDEGMVALVPIQSLPVVKAHAESAPQYRVVTGPPQRTPDVAASLALTQQAAAAVRAGLISTPSPVTTCTDIAEQLLLSGSPALTEILIHKYLHKFARLRPERRLALGRVLLDWLENHHTYADLGAHLHLPRQTAHDQLKAAKALVGDAVEDPQAHAAVIVALRAALTRWERDV